MQFNLEDFNPDAMNCDEMRQWIEFIGPGLRPQVARQWFCGQKDCYRHVRNMRNYLWNALTARDLRLSGEISKAMGYEVICQNIYETLPDKAKW